MRERRSRILVVSAASLILSVGALGVAAAEGSSGGPQPATSGLSDRERAASDRMYLFCTAHDERPLVGCQWSRVDHPRFNAYRLERDGTVIASLENSGETAHFDHGVADGSHTYRVTAVDEAGNAITASERVQVFVGASDIERLRMHCQPFDRAPYSVVACGWEESEHPDFAGYVVMRNGETIAYQAARDENAWADFEPIAGTNTYEVLVVDDTRGVIGRSNQVEVTSSGSSGQEDSVFGWFA